MSNNGDDWEYIRKRNEHLTADEIKFVEDGFRAGRRPVDVARDLKCSSRVIYTRYRQLQHAKGAPTKSHAVSAVRFYKSDFVPT